MREAYQHLSMMLDKLPNVRWNPRQARAELHIISPNLVTSEFGAWPLCPKARRCVGPPRPAEFDLRASVEVTGARKAESRFALGVSDRRAQGPP